MSITGVKTDRPGQVVLLTGNEAVARGALEAGVGFASSYPGSPTAEVLSILGRLAAEFNLYAEWSINEIVALEGAAAASFAGVRALCVMKPDGLNVAIDFLTTLAMSGTKSGLVIFVGDDPNAHSSIKEEDSRYLAKLAHVPVLEPATVAEAKEMVKVAFELSETLRHPVIVRGVTRICHASGNVVLGALPPREKVPGIPPEERFLTNPGAVAAYHQKQEEKLRRAAELGEELPFNRYEGPAGAGILVIGCGPAFLYAREAVASLGLTDRVGLLKLGLTWPLPEKLLLVHLRRAKKVIFAEETDPILEESVTSLAARHWSAVGEISFFGKNSAHVAGPFGPGAGELNVDIMVKALTAVAGLPVPEPAAPELIAGEAAASPAQGPPPFAPVPAIDRELAFCAGCPHRASFWAIRAALELDGRNGFVTGDIGCYTLGLGRTGYYLLRTAHCMGASVGMAAGLGKLARLGFSQPVVAVIGDSTFFHAAVPALIDARYNQARFLCVVLDNGTTAMTGHQPHPGMGVNAMGEGAPAVAIEEVVAGLGIPFTIQDPYAIKTTTRVVFDLLQQNQLHVLILRRECALVAARQTKKPRVYVDQERCLGDACGCVRFCSRVFSCPANIWDAAAGKARIDEAVCTGCGVCA
ncbi:MAG: thiamine pyrophosphate-dependent enzyme, partial [Bacillota bacterium]